LAERVEKTLERHTQVRLRQVTRHGAQPSGTGVSLQRLPTGSHRTSGRRLDRQCQEHFLQRRPVLPTDRPEPANRDSRVGRQVPVRRLSGNTECWSSVLLRSVRRAAAGVVFQTRLVVDPTRKSCPSHPSGLGKVFGRNSRCSSQSPFQVRRDDTIFIS